MATDMTAEEISDLPVRVTMADQSVAMDLDSQPLSDLGVSVMDQDVLERNVAAQVGFVGLFTNNTIGGCSFIQEGG